ncbi:MAG TPA: SprT-like domain-containing protein [Blastocatellia bacterium]|nr:SprT-like domain-containing protein [Blastocatellia bacterium]
MELASADRFGRGLLIQHGLWRKGWRFRFDRARRRLSHCDYQKKIISLSSHLAGLNPAEQVLDAILHQVAHALCRAGDGHNRKWMETARRIGCRPVGFCPGDFGAPERELARKSAGPAGPKRAP